MHRLAKTYPEALTALAARLQAEASTNTVECLIAKYEADELPKLATKTQVGRRQQFKNSVRYSAQCAHPKSRLTYLDLLEGTRRD